MIPYSKSKSSGLRESRLLFGLALAAVVLLVAPSCLAGQGFAALVSPPRFELKAKPGEVLKETVDIENEDASLAQYEIKTADWSLDEQGGVVFLERDLQPESCRTWTRLERHAVKLPSKARKLYRFEVHVPADASAGECRFALLIEPTPDNAVLARAGELQFPIQARIGVIVYVKVGDARPNLEFRGLKISPVNGKPTPVALFFNSGNAHGRPEGILNAVDKNGLEFEMIVSPSPILPGQLREIPIWPTDPEGTGKTVEYTMPLKLKGSIEWDGGKQELNTIVE